MTLPIESSKSTIPITKSERQIALTFAQQQPTCEKAQQVYLNTLAVLVVKHCLDVWEIPTDLEVSHSWNPFGRLCADLADLKITGLGHLECRPVRTKHQTCYVPPEVLENRIGYVVVQIDEQCQEGTVVGFVQSVTNTVLPFSQLQPLEELLIYLEGIVEQKENLSPLKPPVLLNQWFNNVFEGAWQSVEDVFGTRSKFALAFRTLQTKGMELDTPEKLQRVLEQLYASHSLGYHRPDSPTLPSNVELKDALVHLLHTTHDEETRWKAAEILWKIDPDNPATGVRRVMDLGIQLAGQHIALMVAILRTPDRRVSVLLRLYPMGEQRYLPLGLQLAVLSEDGNSAYELPSRERDNYIQLKLCAELGERFSVRITSKGASITENFIV